MLCWNKQIERHFLSREVDVLKLNSEFLSEFALSFALEKSEAYALTPLASDKPQIY